MNADSQLLIRVNLRGPSLMPVTNASFDDYEIKTYVANVTCVDCTQFIVDKLTGSIAVGYFICTEE